MANIELLYNCTLLRNSALVKDDLWVQEGTIIDPATVDFLCDNATDCGGALIAPGFIDLKVNGGYGVNFSNASDLQGDTDRVAQKLPETGVTTFCPSIVTSCTSYYKRVVPKLELRNGSANRGAGILGIHLDGPFISSECVTTYDPKLVRRFDRGFQSVYDAFGHDLSAVCLISLAPELPQALAVIKELRRRRIRVALGHSKASLDTAIAAVNAGASIIAHIFHAMPAFHHRDPGLVGVLATEFPQRRPLYFGSAANERSVHPAALRMAYRIAPESLFLITDAAATVEFSEKKNNVNVSVVKNDDETNALQCNIGNSNKRKEDVASLDACVRSLKTHTGCSTVYALEAATLRPAEAMGIRHKKGTLDFDTDADFVLLQPDTLKVQKTYIGGRCAFSSNS